MSNISKELKAFKDDFETSTGIKVMNVIETRTFYHWKRLVFGHLNSEELRTISDYIIKRFSQPGFYTHWIPVLCAYGNQLTLTCDIELIKKYIMVVDESKNLLNIKL